MPFAGTNIPSGWLLCDGSQISRSTYFDLFNSIGILHGQGNGTTTFNIPDLRGQFLRGAMPSALNSISGSGTASSNNATFTGHGLKRTGIKVRLNSGTLSGLSIGTTYYAIVVDDNTVAFATTQANAIAGTKIVISGANSGIITQWEDPDAGSRAANTIGGASSGVGSGQVHDYGAHTHGVYPTNSGWGTPSSQFSLSGNSTLNTTPTLSSGGNETRPQNIAINYIIKI